MKNIEMIKGILELGEHLHYGLRKDNMDYEIGEELEVSHQWFQDAEYDFQTGELVFPFDEEMRLYDAGALDGTSPIEIKEDDNVEEKINYMAMYEGKNLYLVAGPCANYGNDRHELVIENAIVLAKL